MKTIVIGASNNEERYAYKAVKMLLQHDHEVIPVSNKKDVVLGNAIKGIDTIEEGVDTITMYVGPKNQEFYKEYILNTNPRRVIFNPGTENPEFEDLLEEKGIIVDESCTLVLLSTGQY
jgi:predicted CoA-binding protein